MLSYFRMHQYHTTPFPATPLPLLGGASSPPPHDYLSSAVKHRYTTDMFRQKYFTSFTSQMPVLGIQSPMSVNLNFTCGPDIVNTGIQYRWFILWNIDQTILTSIPMSNAWSKILKFKDLIKNPWEIHLRENEKIISWSHYYRLYSGSARSLPRVREASPGLLT